jgi:hypothetical protein
MGYNLSEISLQNYARKITDTTPLQISVGGISANDTTTLIVSVVVGAITGTANLSLEESVDGGISWATIPGTTVSGALSAPGTYSIRISEVSGIISPVVRLVVTADAGAVLYLSRVFRTVSSGDNIIPRAILSLTGQATEAKQDVMIASLTNIEGYIDGVEGELTTLNAKDFATSAKQDTIIGHVDGIEAELTTLNAKDFATSAKQDTIIGHVDGIEAELTTLNAKDFATSAKQDTIIGHVDGIEAQLTTITGHVDGIEGALTTLNAKDFATAAKQDTIIGHVNGVESELISISAFIDGIETQLSNITDNVDDIEGKLDTLNAKDFATETTLQKLREWPYATWDKQALTEGATTDTWTYTSGVTTVGTITITYTDATKGTIQDVVYSPVKAV